MKATHLFIPTSAAATCLLLLASFGTAADDTLPHGSLSPTNIEEAPENAKPQRDDDGEEAAEEEAAPQRENNQANNPRRRAQREAAEAAEEEGAEEGEEKPEEDAGEAAEAEAEVENDPIKEQLARLESERDVLDLLISVSESRTKEEALERRAALEEQKLQIEELKAAQEMRDLALREEAAEELAELKAQSERLTLENTIVKAQAERIITQLKTREAQLLSEINTLSLRMQEQEKAMALSNYSESEPVYLEDPLDGDTLVISDRRIPLNGPITSRLADQISERINYFNNKSSEHPIFIVIDDSPGGSVMAGYKIIKSMESSDAPVFVVLKSFAASMAACITTVAERSFAYPNAVMLHHQISSGLSGNLTEQREWVEEIEQWWERLAQPVADKMGISLDDFIEQMYANDSAGDWEEFADDAAELKWVDTVVSEIRETSLLRNPDFRPSSSSASSEVDPRSAELQAIADTIAAGYDPTLVEEKDERGRASVRLPRINPYDAYWLFNPDGYYHAQ